MSKHVAPHRWADALAGEVSPAERAEMEAHAASCAKCAIARANACSARPIRFPMLRQTADAGARLGFDPRARPLVGVEGEARDR